MHERRDNHPIFKWSRRKSWCLWDIQNIVVSITWDYFYHFQVNTHDPKWLNRTKVWDRLKSNHFVVHGYAGGDNSIPIGLVRDAYLRNGQFNLFLVDYGPVGRPPCYVAMVNNVNYVSYCIASYINQLQRKGMSTDSITLIGHSIGAHICGHLTKRLHFRVRKIIGKFVIKFNWFPIVLNYNRNLDLGLDPALPLITDKIRLNRANAERVHTLQTNAGFFGELGAIGHVDICVNSGIKQPFCEDANSMKFAINFWPSMNWENPFHFVDVNACSHLWALCFMAQSLYKEFPQEATKCSKVCPHYGVFQIVNQLAPLDLRINATNQPDSILFGVDIPARCVILIFS